MAWAANKAPIVLAGPLSGARSAHAPLLEHAARHLDRLGLAYCLEDDQAQPAVALAVAKKWAARECAAVIGHFNSACAEIALPVYRRRGIALLLPTASQDGLTDGGGGFRLCARDSQQARAMLEYVARTGLPGRHIELVLDGSPYSLRIEAALRNAAPDLEIPMADPLAAPGQACRLRLVLATCQGALDIAARMRHWDGAALYSDDAFVQAFARQAPAMQTLTVGPEPDYDQAIIQACDLVAAARAAGAPCLRQWLAGRGIFDEFGNALAARWRIHVLKSRGLWEPIDD